MTAVLDPSDLSWMDEGACRKARISQPRRTSLFYRDGETNDTDRAIRATAKQYKDAKKLCDNCQVAEECLEYALNHRECCGMWGGKTRVERRRILRQRAKAGLILRETEVAGLYELE